MTGIKELAYVVYEASSLDDWERFGVDLLGMQLAEKSADAIALRTDAKAHRWLVRRGPADDLAASGYEVTDGAALDEIVERLAAAGADVAEGDAALAADRRVDRIAVTTDPLGNRVELVTGFADAPSRSARTCCSAGSSPGRGARATRCCCPRGSRGRRTWSSTRACSASGSPTSSSRSSRRAPSPT
ncbi:hypothetical protein [Actinomadura sp. CNU-125]|uniref:hypothetical protein n=1 Tax=Actinomadura sp. CNU-125 TaxID=1904961 RepID=UPI0021CCBCE6|nr:hypothetical protein [Actinomadura sp. CNU-125]